MKQLGICKDNILVVTYVAGYRKEKNHFYLLNAFKYALEHVKLNNIEILLFLVGYGPEETAIKKKIMELGLEDNIILTGRRYDIPEILRASDIAVHTSFVESFGLGIVEAMASGLPILALANNSVENFVRNGYNGIVLPENTPYETFGEVLVRLLENKRLRYRIGKRAREIVEKYFSLQGYLLKIFNLYEEVIS